MESIKNILKRIECNTLLATKTVLTVDDVATLTGLSKSHYTSLHIVIRYLITNHLESKSILIARRLRSGLNEIVLIR